MNKITPEHLARDAYVYVRQSTADQLLKNPESRRRQYALVARARALGWENAIVIDDDLGRSGSGQLRPGFERLLAAICAGTTGAVLAIEASRLARNGRDWHTLLEFCAFVNSLIIDEDGIYDPRLVNDRLLLGLKGTFSELELSIFRQRSQEALRLKAARGELYTTVAIGYRRSADDRLEQDPDRRIREALSLVFRKFSEIGSVRQLALWLRQEGIDLPIAVYGRQGRRDTRYICNAEMDYASDKKCITFSNMRVDAAVSAEVLRAISPLAIEAALQLIEDRERAGAERLRQSELALEQARYEATHARRQYDAVDPDNRLVAGELERRWNERLATVARLEEQIQSLQSEQPSARRDEERATLLALADDWPRLWSHPAASSETRKRILRAVLNEIIVTVEADRLRLVLHWQGGDHTRLEVVKNRTGQNRWKTDMETVQLVRELARTLPDHSIAPFLNRLGIRSAKGKSWTQLRVRNFRSVHQIAVYRERERAERHELILHEAASRLGVSKMTVVRLIRDRLLPARQVCVGAPYVICEDDLDRPAVRRALANGRAVSPDPRQESLSFQ